MGGPGSTGSAEDMVNAAVNATSPPPRTLPGLTPSLASPSLPQHPPSYLGDLSLLTLDNPTTTTSPSPTCDAQARQHSLELKGRHEQGRGEGRTGY